MREDCHQNLTSDTEFQLYLLYLRMSELIQRRRADERKVERKKKSKCDYKLS